MAAPLTHTQSLSLPPSLLCASHPSLNNRSSRPQRNAACSERFANRKAMGHAVMTTTTAIELRLAETVRVKIIHTRSPHPCTMFSNVCETNFRNHQAKMVALACGLHARLGDRSQVGLLDEQTLMMIAHDVPGKKCLLQEWRECDVTSCTSAPRHTTESHYM